MSAPLPTPAERLALSRERLRVAIARNAKPQPSHDNPGVAADLLGMLKATLPGASVLMDLVGEWWKRHPLHTSSVLASDLVQTVLRPMVRRHPVALTAGAVVLGAALVWGRPWRWALRAQVLYRWGPTVLSSLLASAAVRSWLATALAQKPEATATSAPVAPASAPSSSQPPQESAPTGL